MLRSTGRSEPLAMARPRCAAPLSRTLLRLSPGKPRCLGPCLWGCQQPQTGLAVSVLAAAFLILRLHLLRTGSLLRRSKAGSPHSAARIQGSSRLLVGKARGRRQSPSPASTGRIRGSRYVIQVFSNGRKIPGFNLFTAFLRAGLSKQ